MQKKVAICQSNYIPWKGYFDLISKVDLFIFHDDLQYTKNDWRNRNLIKTQNGLKWITIPCGSNEKRLINEVVIEDPSWQKKHWQMIKLNYKKATYFNEYKDFFEEFYLNNEWKSLSELNQFLIINIVKRFLNNNKTKFEKSEKYNLKSAKDKRLIELLKKSKATHYYSGPAAKNYIKDSAFENSEIKIHWMNYKNYKIYDQLYGKFEHQVSILDLLFNLGKESKHYLKSR